MGSPEGTPSGPSDLRRNPTFSAKMIEKIYRTFVILVFCSNIYSIFLYVSLIAGSYDLLFSNIPNPYFYIVNPFLLFPLNFILALLLLMILYFRSTKDIYHKLNIINFFIPLLWILYIVIYVIIDPTVLE